MLKRVNWQAVLQAFAYIVIGILMIIYPSLSASVASYIIGIAFIVFGGIQLITYFILDIADTLYRNDFVVGLMALIFGILVIVKQNFIVNLIPIILGLLMMMSGFSKLQRAVIAKRIGYSNSMVYVILATISIVFGVMVMFFLSGEAMKQILFIVIGSGLIYCGVSDLFANFFLANKYNEFVKAFEKKAKEEDQNVIDVEATNEKDEM